MDDNLATRVRCAAVAGWWTLLIAAAVLMLDWIVYLIVVPAQPAFVLTLWGPGATWPEVRTLWFWFLAGFKVCLGVGALLLVWLTLWARQLRRSTGTP
jgi:hypothetical protein